MAILMSVAFALPVYYLCQMQGSFFVFWLAWLISLADGIGKPFTPFLAATQLTCLTASRQGGDFFPGIPASLS